MVGIYMLLCCSSLLAVNQVCADVNCPTDSEENLQIEQCAKEIPDIDEKPGCLMKCMMKVNNLMGDDDIPIVDKVSARVEKCADKPTPDDELQKIVTCLRNHVSGPNFKTDEPDCKSYLELWKCYPEP